MMMKKLSKMTWMMLLGCCLACTTEEVIFDADVQLAADLQAVSEFVLSNNLVADQHESGFYYIVNEPGDPASIADKCDLRFKVEVRGLDSTFYFSTDEESYLFQTEPGVTENTYNLSPCFYFGQDNEFVLYQLDGIIGVGGQVDLIVPSGLGFATQYFSLVVFPNTPELRREVNIPPNTNLLISAELIYAE